MQEPDKHELRAQLVAARRARTPEELQRARTGVCAAVLARAAQERWRTVAGYVPLRTEPGSPELLAGLATLGARVIVPVLREDRDLDWRPWDAEQTLGVGAISGVDAALVPALAAAPDGTRLGRGGGSYDRALARLPEGVPVAALLFDGELLPDLPRDAWDQPVTAVVTPSGWRDLRAPTGAPGGNSDFASGG